MSDTVKDAREFYAEAKSFESDWREEAKDDLDFRNLKQWDDEASRARSGAGKEPPRPLITLDVTDQFLRQIVNDARMNPPSMKAIPMDDDADVEVAEQLNGWFRYIEAVSRAQQAYMTAFDAAVTIGRGVFRVRTTLIDEERNFWEPRIDPIDNPLALYFDRYSNRLDGSDASDAMLVTQLSRREFKRRYPGAEESAGWEGDGGVDEWASDSGILVAEWHHVDTTKTKIIKTKTGEMTEEEAARVKPKNFREVTRESRICTVRTMTGREVIEENRSHFKSVGLVPVYGVVRVDGEGKRQWRGALRAAKDPQKMLNFLASNFAEAASSAPRAPWVVPADAVAGYQHFWDKANVLSLPYLPYNHKDKDQQPLPPPQRQMADLNLMGYVSGMQAMTTFVQGALGQYQSSIGAASNETSGKAILAREQQSDTGTFHFVDNLAQSVQHGGRLVMECLPETADQYRILQVLGEDGTQDQVAINPHQKQAFKQGKHKGREIVILNPMIGEYDIQIITGPSFGSRRQEAVQMMQEMLSRDPNLTQLVGDLFFGMMDAPGAKEISARLKLMLPDVIKAADKAGEDVPPEVVAVTQRVIQMVQAREEGITATMAELTKLFEQVREAHAQLKEASAKLTVQDANLKVDKMEVDQARAELEGLLNTPVDPMTGQPIQQAPQQPAQPQQAAPQDDGLGQVLMALAQSQEQMMAAQEQTNQLLVQIAQALAPPMDQGQMGPPMEQPMDDVPVLDPSMALPAEGAQG